MTEVAEKPSKTKPRPKPLGTLIDEIWARREDKRQLEADLKKVEDDIAVKETALMERLQAEGCEKATGTKASISVTSSVSADVTDWDKLWAYIYKNKLGHLLQKRVSDPAWRELTIDLKKDVPGTQPFTKYRLNIRSL